MNILNYFISCKLVLGYVILNVDEAFSAISREIGMGGLIREGNRAWKCEFYANVRGGDLVCAEIGVANDSVEIVDYVANDSVRFHTYAMLRVFLRFIRF